MDSVQRCISGQVIVVSWANYGRRDKTTCPDGRSDSELQNVKCSWSATLHLLSASADSPFTCIHRCNWQNSCTVEAPSLVDPCHGTYEYLEVFFTCQSVICEGSQANLQCDEGQVIVVSWANYGRRESLISARKLESSVDLCAGTYKYLEVF
uniref:SUEL-type lectin domain-containing protein n=1 Tax=Haplochromis burtoni TaxID=8153 RepID=A0A3Q3CSA8_HAPBU